MTSRVYRLNSWVSLHFIKGHLAETLLAKMVPASARLAYLKSTIISWVLNTAILG